MWTRPFYCDISSVARMVEDEALCPRAVVHWCAVGQCTVVRLPQPSKHRNILGRLTPEDRYCHPPPAGHSPSPGHGILTQGPVSSLQ